MSYNTFIFILHNAVFLWSYFKGFAIEPTYKKYLYTLWLFNIAMENGPFTDDFPIKTFIYEGFSMAMLNNQMVYIYKDQPSPSQLNQKISHFPDLRRPRTDWLTTQLMIQVALPKCLASIPSMQQQPPAKPWLRTGVKIIYIYM